MLTYCAIKSNILIMRNLQSRGAALQKKLSFNCLALSIAQRVIMFIKHAHGL